METVRERPGTDTPPDQELLETFTRSGDSRVFDTIVERYSQLVYSVCVRVLDGTHSADDASQATFLVLVKRARHLPSGTVLSSWLYLTAQNCARALRRSAARRAKHEREAVVTSGDFDSNDKWNEIRPHLDEAIASLPSAQREALVLRYIEGLSIDAAAQRLSITTGSLKARTSRALDSLRERLHRRCGVVTAVALAAMLTQRTAETLPAGLNASLKSAAASSTAVSPVAAQLACAVVQRSAFAGKAALTAKIAAVILGSTIAGIAIYQSTASAPATQPVPKLIKRTLYQCDFEAGTLPRQWEHGTILPNPAGGANKHCLSAAETRFGPAMRLTFAPALRHSPSLTLSFDYCAGATLKDFVVQVGNVEQKQNYDIHIPNVTANLWRRQTLAIGRLEPIVHRERPMHAGDHIEDLWINVPPNTELLIDNIEIFDEPDSSPRRD